MITDFISVRFKDNPDTSDTCSIAVTLPDGVTHSVVIVACNAPSPLSTPENGLPVFQGYQDFGGDTVQVQGNIGSLTWMFSVQCPGSPLTGTISAGTPGAAGLSVPITVASSQGGGSYTLAAGDGSGSFSLPVANVSAEQKRQLLDELTPGRSTPRR